jgi:glycosyltransferase involved in cell wall biosynthesis
MLELIRRLDSTRWAVHVVCFRGNGAWCDRIPENAAVTVFPVSTFRGPSLFRHMSAFAGWCQSHRIAVVHSADLPANIFAMPAAAFARVPVRVANRRELVAGRSLGQLVAQRWAYACAHRIVANSRASAARLALEGVRPRAIAIVRNGIDNAAFQPRVPRPVLRRVVTVANLRHEKRHDVLVDAAAQVLRRVPDARFELIGNGPQREALVERARARGVLHAFTFAGYCDDVPGRLAAADIFVLPSDSEAFPNALLEAMAAGMPVVASNVGGISELVDDGRTGLLVPPGDPASLAVGLSRLIADPALASRLGVSARSVVDGQYSFDRMTAAFESIYVGELARRAGLPGKVGAPGSPTPRNGQTASAA